MNKIRNVKTIQQIPSLLLRRALSEIVKANGQRTERERERERERQREREGEREEKRKRRGREEEEKRKRRDEKREINR